MSTAAPVRLEGMSKTYPGQPSAAVDGVSLEVDPASFFSILGPSGCGKTTLLRIIAGFEYPDEGRVFIGDEDVTELSPRDRDIAMVFQDYALYPHMTVAQNIGFNLRNSKVPKREIETRVAETAETLHITELLKKKPGHLSGGEQQRVALGRALIRQPKVFLLDEPLSNLDLKLREAMRIELASLHREFGITTIYVTHDQAEAMTLSTRLAVMSAGRLQQSGAPDAVYARPNNTFVARFIGSPSMSLFRVQREGDRLRGIEHPDASLPLPSSIELAEGDTVLAGVRPQDLTLTDGVVSPGIPVEVSLTEHLGRNNYVVCTARGPSAFLYDEEETIQVETPPGVFYDRGTELTLTAEPSGIRIFSAEGAATEDGSGRAGGATDSPDAGQAAASERSSAE